MTESWLIPTMAAFSRRICSQQLTTQFNARNFDDPMSKLAASRRPRGVEPSCLFPDEKEIARLVMGDRAASWPGAAAVLEKAGLPRIDPLFGGRYWPAVVGFLDRRHDLQNGNVTSAPDGVENPNYDKDWKKRWRRGQSAKDGSSAG